MDMKHCSILDEIAAFAPEDGNWLPLDYVLGRLWGIGVTQECVPVLFAVFERFPDEDGVGVLWSIVHGVEALELDYEPLLRQSLFRQSSCMGRIMLDRLERANAG